MNVREKLSYEIEEIEEGRYRVEVKLFNEVTLGILYFENPKQRWYSKPIMSDKLRCVDAKVEQLYVYGGENLTPKEVVATCQDLLSEHIKKEGKKLKVGIKSEYKNYTGKGETEQVEIGPELGEDNIEGGEENQ